MNIDVELTRAERIIAETVAGVSLRFDPAEDESVDDGATVFVDGRETEITMQFGYRYICVNEWVEDEGAMYHHYSGNSIIAAARSVAAVLSA
jgi:hypothetical protein